MAQEREVRYILMNISMIGFSQIAIGQIVIAYEPNRRSP